MELIVIRHARPERLVGIAGGADPALTDIGLRQAEALARWVADEPIDAIYVSPMLRAVQTCDPLAGVLGMTAKIEPGVREYDAFHDEYIPMEEVKADKEAWRAWLDSDQMTPPDSFHQDVRGAVTKIVDSHPGERVALVCHGGVINSIAADVLGLGPRMFFSPDYTSINRFLFSSRGHKGLVSLNDIGHLHADPDLQLSE